MRTLLIQPQARLDLLLIWNHIAEENFDAANRVLEKIDAEIQSLLSFPGKGHSRSEVKNDDYRFWRVYSYMIAYRYNDLTVTIVRVVHGRRSFRSLFKNPPKRQNPR